MYENFVWGPRAGIIVIGVLICMVVLMLLILFLHHSYILVFIRIGFRIITDIIILFSHSHEQQSAT